MSPASTQIQEREIGSQDAIVPALQDTLEKEPQVLGKI